ncbi:hypothetical protein NDU88_000914 [Pleurodeles waltl]|uniref:Uncharacterized protein n=1 Tax=Pleurodeles waltl TaxID=8319 RepID=A0AAV7KZ75_PLEWA|nr:hypothetical protein NDU88_000914 [Pleurodeles waltl]
MAAGTLCRPRGGGPGTPAAPGARASRPRNTLQRRGARGALPAARERMWARGSSPDLPPPVAGGPRAASFHCGFIIPRSVEARDAALVECGATACTRGRTRGLFVSPSSR